MGRYGILLTFMQLLDFEISDYKEYGSGRGIFLRNVCKILRNYGMWKPRTLFFIVLFHPNVLLINGIITLNGILKNRIVKFDLV